MVSDEPVLVDHDAGAFALAPEALHRLPVRIDVGLDAHDRGDELFQRGRVRGQRGKRSDRKTEQNAAGVPHDSSFEGDAESRTQLACYPEFAVHTMRRMGRAHP